jgi:cytoskeletal protein RodZ
VENICNHCGSVKSDPKNKRMKPDSQPKRIVEQPQIVEKLENEDPKGFVAFTWRILLFIFIGIMRIMIAILHIYQKYI